MRLFKRLLEQAVHILGLEPLGERLSPGEQDMLPHWGWSRSSTDVEVEVVQSRCSMNVWGGHSLHSVIAKHQHNRKDFILFVLI